MAMVTASSHLSLNPSSPLVLRASRFLTNARPPSSKCFPAPMPPVTSASASNRSRKTLLSPFVINNDKFSSDIVEDDDAADQEQQVGNANANETLLYSFSPLPLLLLAALPGAGTVASLFEPFVELVKSFGLPGWLVHWGHPGNMAVVLFAMGGYGTYLGYRIRFSDDVEEKANAKDLHPKLLAGMFFFFALGATGGVTSLLTSDKPIFERYNKGISSCALLRLKLICIYVCSPHAVTGLIGLSLLTIQTILPALFEGKPELRTVHGVLGTGIMTLFVVHAALGLQLGLSY
ncbi:uncharacterized protein LOC103965675 isoform X1 [Pyrus x bretschneideri]|uniref:uncharacterized protein LOC103965675 isoform X1 n=1 Tax=Pyrus x bretschneideri TaxID=225117 RepID=UPI00202DE15F|nr:uncharacterized protein LOC103965675 isoform X1 [Pyrus x bretschneideri]